MIADVFEAFAESEFLTAVAGLEIKFGSEHLDDMSAPPRIVFAPVGAQSVVQGQAMRALPTDTPRLHVMRHESVRIRIWAKGEEDSALADARATEALLDRCIWALRHLARLEVKFDRTEWVAADGQEVLQYGRCVDLFASFAVPVVLSLGDVGLAAAEVKTLPATSMTGTMVFEPEGTNETGTPAP